MHCDLRTLHPTNPPNRQQAVRGLALFLAMLCLSCGSDAGIAWERAPRRLFPGRDAQIAVRSSGAVSMISAEPTVGGHGMNLMYRTSHDQGDQFSAPVQINDQPGQVSSHGENSAQLAFGNQAQIFVVWNQGSEIAFSVSRDFGRSFAPSRLVSESAAPGARAPKSFQNLYVTPKSEIYISWLDGNDPETPPGTSALWLARSLDAGQSFERVRVATGVCPCCRPTMAQLPDQSLVLAWRHVLQGDERAISMSRSSDAGKSWASVQRVADDSWIIAGCPHSGPALYPTKDGLGFLWYLGADDRAQIRDARLQANGKFSASHEAQGGVLDANHVKVWWNTDSSWMIFQGRDPHDASGWGGVIRPWIARKNKIRGWSRPAALPVADSNISYPALAGDATGHLYATWTETIEGVPQVVLLRGRIESR